MGLSIWQILIILVVVLLLFGAGGRIPRVMGDVGKGIRNMKKGLTEDDEPKSLESKEAEIIPPAKETKKTKK